MPVVEFLKRGNMIQHKWLSIFIVPVSKITLSVVSQPVSANQNANPSISSKTAQSVLNTSGLSGSIIVRADKYVSVSKKLTSA